MLYEEDASLEVANASLEENTSLMFLSTMDEGTASFVGEEVMIERIEAFLDPMTEMFGTYFRPTEIVNRLQSLKDTERQGILSDSWCHSERGMRSLLERLVDMDGATLIEFYRLVTTMDDDSGDLPLALLSGAGSLKHVEISDLMRTFIVELVEQKNLEKLTPSDLKNVVEKMVGEELMKKPRKNVEDMDNTVEAFFHIFTLVRKSNPDWPLFLWDTLRKSRPDLFPPDPEVQEDNASSISTESRSSMESDASSFGLSETAANLSLSSSGSSVKSTSSKVKRKGTGLRTLQQLRVTPKNSYAVENLLDSGALKEEQVTDKEVEKTKSQEDAWNAKADWGFSDSDSDGEDEDKENTLLKVPYQTDSNSRLDVDLKLRKYQNELAGPALQGKNTIVCAPTGSGKTRVAMEIIIKHLKGNAGAKYKSKKVCFFARTVPLAVQQYKTIRMKLPDDYKINIFTGDSENSSDMHLLLPELDVVVLTPMILQNHISRGNVEDLNVFSLLVFDECHHTREKEPYNTLMASYVDKKLMGEKNLPQVVGLTASFPVEKARDVSSAVESILQLCGNLDAHLISVVSKNVSELNKLVPVPNEEIEYLRERDQDESFRKIIGVMEKLEENAADCARDLGNGEVSSIVSSCPSDDRKLQKYNNWTVELLNKSVLVPRSSRETNMSVRLLMIISQYLTKYHFALETHDLVHLEDVTDFLDDCFAANKYDEFQTNGETRLYDYFKELKDSMRNLHHIDNPNLRHLVKVIVEKLLNAGVSSRGIIFVRTRAIAEALASWLNRCENEDIRNLKASIFTGTNAKESQGGMTQAQQNALVEKFREGKVRLLVATSVAEEGMDVPECNLVIKYNHVGNEITTIQTRGRSRKAGGNSFLLAMSKICEKEMINRQRTVLMYEGIDVVTKMDSEDFIDQVVRKQIMAKDARDLEKLIESENQEKYKDKKFTMVCKLCRKFTIHSDYLRTLCKNHRVVVDRNVWDQKKIYISNPKYLDEIQIVGSVQCDSEVEDGIKCRGPLGTIVFYCSNFFLAVGIKNFTINEENRNEPRAVKKWKMLPYPLQELSTLDIANYIKQKKDKEPDCDLEGAVGGVHIGVPGEIREKSAVVSGVQETAAPSADSYLSSFGASVADAGETIPTMSSAELREMEERCAHQASSSSSYSEAASSTPSTYTSRESHHETQRKELVAMSELDSGVDSNFPFSK